MNTIAMQSMINESSVRPAQPCSNSKHACAVSLPYCVLRASFRTESEIRFPQNPVNTLRGGLGFHLKRAVCFHRARTAEGELVACAGCLLEKNCVYALLMETAAPGTEAELATGGARETPRPMHFAAEFAGPICLAPGDTFMFIITLFGRASEAIPYLIFALKELGQHGFTREQIRAPLDEVRMLGELSPMVYKRGVERLEPIVPDVLSLVPPLVSEADETRDVELRFLTPVSFKDKQTGKVSNLPDFSRLIGSILRRLTSLCVVSGIPAPQWDFTGIMEQARTVQTVDVNGRFVRWERYSQRQHQRSYWGGMVGNVVYRGRLAPFLPLLRAGEIFHVGRGISFGQGRYRIQRIAVPEGDACSTEHPDSEPIFLWE
ncbi:MAG TPA: CRISPR system precrRNA processing endoribonuclease RAMP protein Cas6 [Candidatus Ozemobacteraceae bacterium]|nr:CRISPR system precrRNA processing endoribonuclease RAMP protein Cas6 [Candidatus Ozemobacteraceae bacterium]